jgi:hypothetical protein
VIRLNRRSKKRRAAAAVGSRWRRGKNSWSKEANQIFAPIENYLGRLAEVLRASGASVEVDAKWEHRGDQKLRRVAKVRSSASAQQLHLNFTVQGASIFYRDKRYRFLRGIEALMPVITSDVEQFLTSTAAGWQSP